MSAIAGILYLDGTERVGRRLLQAVARPAPGDVVDALGYWQGEAVGLGHALARTTYEADREQQPLLDPISRCVMVFDGRLDNRSELHRSLVGYERLIEQQTDAAYTLAAYLRWGERAPNHLIGDFAFAIWNPRVHQLLLARDPLGARPLYYSLRGNRLTFTSTLEQMLNDPTLPQEVNEAAIVGHLLSDASVVGQQTAYRQVQVMPGGHYLLVDGQRVRRVRYWQWPEHPPEQRFASEKDMEEFRELFAEAVRCRMRSNTPAGLLLSGGLDSGAIACMAGHLHEQTGSPQIRAYSFVFDRFTSCDERAYSTAAASRYGFEHTCLPADDRWTLSQLEQWLPVFTEPFFAPYDGSIYKMLARARSDGLRVMLTGDGGDLLLTGSPQYITDWLVQGCWGALHEQIRAQARAKKQPYARRFAIGVIFPLLPVGLQEALQYRGMPRQEAWVPTHLRKQYQPDAPTTWYPDRNGWWHRNAWWYLLRSQLSRLGQTSVGSTHMDRMMRLFALEARHPFLDVRLVKFILRTPPDASYRNGTTKMLLREGLHDILPPIICDRQDKANLSPLMHLGLRRRRRAFVESLLEDSELELRGYVLPGPWKQAVQTYLQKEEAPTYWNIWRSLVLEMWLRLRAGRLPPLDGNGAGPRVAGF